MRKERAERCVYEATIVCPAYISRNSRTTAWRPMTGLHLRVGNSLQALWQGLARMLLSHQLLQIVSIIESHTTLIRVNLLVLPWRNTCLTAYDRHCDPHRCSSGDGRYSCNCTRYSERFSSDKQSPQRGKVFLASIFVQKGRGRLFDLL